jgi:hypothetical protein
LGDDGIVVHGVEVGIDVIRIRMTGEIEKRRLILIPGFKTMEGFPSESWDTVASFSAVEGSKVERNVQISVVVELYPLGEWD